MKKIIFPIIFLFSLMAFSQVSLKKLDGTAINDGETLDFSELTDPNNYLGLKIYNSSSEEILVKIKVVSITNSSASDLQLCINPICVNNLVVGNSYPNTGSTIPANGSNWNLDHFLNGNPGDGINPVSYTFKLFIDDGAGNEIGNSVTFTYRYTPNLAANSFVQLARVGVELKSNVLNNSIDFDALYPVVLKIYDLNGKLVSKQTFQEGTNSYSVSDLERSMYVLNFVSLDGVIAKIKVIKK